MTFPWCYQKSEWTNWGQACVVPFIPRPLRSPAWSASHNPDFADGFYKVLACGNRRATIFHDDADYRAYLERYRQCDGVTLHTYG